MQVKKKIFITGGTGFIGQALTRELGNHSLKFGVWNKSSSLVIPKKYQCIELDHLQSSDIKDYDAVVHLAGRVHKINDNSNDSFVKYQKSNIDLTVELAKKSINAGVKIFIFASSVKAGDCEGMQMDTVKTWEKNFKGDDYGCSKLEAEYALEKIFDKVSNSKCLMFRLPLVYGPGVKGNILRLLRTAKKGIRLPLKAAKGKRSMLYVRNLSSAFSKVIGDETLGRANFKRYYLTDGNDITSNEMYSMIYEKFRETDGTFYLPEMLLRLVGTSCSGLEKVTGKNLSFNKELVSRLFDEYRFLSEPFCKDYGWKPPHTQEEGIADTVNWFISTDR